MQTEIKEDIITTKELVSKLVNVLRLVNQNWRIILICGGLCSLLSLLFDAKNYQKPIFVANTTFSLENGSTGGGGNELAGLAAAFGVGGGGASNADLFSGDNFWQMLSTRSVIERALMSEITVKGKKILMVNFYINESGIIQKEWAGSLFERPKTEYIKYRFKQKDIETFDEFENAMMGSIYEKIVGHTETGQVGNSTIAFINVRTQHELLSKIWAETLLKSIYDFYKEFKTKKTELLLKVAQKRVDSLRTTLRSTEQNLATYTNQNQGIIIAEGQMLQQRMERDKSFSSNLYMQTMAQVDQLKTLLLNQTPLYTIIEPIRFPLKVELSGYGSNIVLGAMAGFVLCIVFLVLRSTLKEILQQI